jgi:hypothetical protein
MGVPSRPVLLSCERLDVLRLTSSLKLIAGAHETLNQSHDETGIDAGMIYEWTLAVFTLA